MHLCKSALRVQWNSVYNFGLSHLKSYIAKLEKMSKGGTKLIKGLEIFPLRQG